jgi:polyhydroxybutyrate depolymerase
MSPDFLYLRDDIKPFHMIKKLLSFFIGLSAFAGISQTTVVDSIISGGIYRSYRLYVPALYNASSARPLIINMHGYTSNASAQQLYSNFGPIADTANFLMVFPQGTMYMGQPFWNAGISPTLVDDKGFIDHLIDSLKLTYNIDMNSVYATGMSNGGYMSQTLACELSNRIAAIASVTGAMFPSQAGANCHATRPVPMMQIHGTADGTVPYNGSSTSMPIDSVVRHWVLRNGCNPVPTFSNVPNTNTTDGCTAEHYVYSNGNSGSSVELYKIIGGAHTWPGAPFTIGVTNQDFKASVEIWRFFRKYKLNTLTSIRASEKENLNLNVYPNPANDVLNVSFDAGDKTATIIISDVLGHVVIKENYSAGKINTSGLATGMYVLCVVSEGELIGKLKFMKE